MLPADIEMVKLQGIMQKVYIIQDEVLGRLDVES